MKSNLIFRLASKRLDELYNMWANGELKSHPYALARRKLCVEVLQAYYRARGASLYSKEYAYCESLIVEGGTYGEDVARIIREHGSYRTGTMWGVNQCQAIDSWGYVGWVTLPIIIHYMAGRPNGRIG